ncbi:acetate--CoA ligase [Sphingomonas sp. AP4-R1]|uniref:acetate--CoA ligase n=1 Tax=Sphingomonas sp. AP4-R1 TaxID=2735134 RepID=UPI0014938A7B|nr:acetate--CoA ligase [Sphingomonas sp. AP4-R1]QJU60108.1 acetate--CoA ligase [Sphingomonas sp. AP4-R1]
MADDLIPIPATFQIDPLYDSAGYARDYHRSLHDPDGFWRDQVHRLDWIETPTRMDESSFHEADFGIRWFADGTLNVAANCLDRHLATRPDQTAILWEPDNPADAPRAITYAQLHEDVCRLGAALRALGAGKGARVAIYMPMIPEAAVAMLACARIGAIHSVVFGGFSPDALAGRIQDSDAGIVITADEGRRGGKSVPLKVNVNEALRHCPGVHAVLVVRSGNDTGGAPDVVMQAGRDHWYDEVIARVPPDCPPEPMNACDPLFILYTSGSTGKPKGVVHSSGGYLLWAALTHQACFDYRPGQIFWCAADVGWITGHTYIVYGALANGATTLMYEGVPNWPTASRMWEVVERHKVEILFTAPTVLRSLMREGDEPVARTDRSSLRLLGSVGEPINPEAWRWYHDVVGEGRCPVIDMWWQTETGGGMIAPLPGAIPLKRGSATMPLFGIQPELVSADGQTIKGPADGNLVIARSWPGQMCTVWNDHARFFQAYFSTYPGYYFTGDGARRDADGYWWITGRVDDVINVSGHRMGTAEVESALVLHHQVAEAAVVGMPHALKGQGIYAYVTLNVGELPSEDLRRTLRDWVRREIGPIAAPDAIQFAPGLPKTRSGKIMRRILRKIAEGEVGALGDISTLADPSVVDHLIANRAS